MSQDTDPATTRSEAVAWSEGNERFADVVEATTLEEASQDAVLVGEPYDGGVVDQPGAREGPDAIRAALADLRTHHLDAGPVSSVGDLGDIDVPAGESVTAVQRQVREVAAAVHESEAIPVFLGGDGSLTGANVGPLLARQRADGGYVTDGGFGEDDEDEDVGEVEHFDPTGEASADDEDDTGEETPDDEATISVEEEIVINGEDDRTAESEEEVGTTAGTESDEAHEVEEVTDSESGEEEASVKRDAEAAEAESGEEKASVKSDAEAASAESDGAAADTKSDEKERGTEAGETESEAHEAEAEDAEQTEDGEADDETLGEVATIESASSERGSVERDTERESGEHTSAAGGETVGIVSLDAHLDCQVVDGQPSNATTYRQLFGAGLDALAVVGARHFESSTDEAEYLREQGGTVVTAEEVGEDAVVAADRALDALGDVDAVYVSVDLDVLDTTAAPGVSTPTPGGLTTRELFRLLRVLASDERLAGIEVVEAAPPLCPDGRTAEAGARAVAHALAVAGAGPTRT